MQDDQELKFAERLGIFEGKLLSVESKLDACLSSLTELKAGIGQRTEKHGEKIAVLENQIGTINKFAGWVLAPIISAIVLAILSMFAMKR